MNTSTAKTNLPALFCKPVSGNSILYNADSSNGRLVFRSLDLNIDLETIYQWVNQEYARAFWQMNGSKEVLKNTYAQMLSNPYAHSFIALLDEIPVGQIDLYLVKADELSDHVETCANDCGLHILMLPPKESKKNLAKEVLSAFIQFFFSHAGAGDLYAEPDTENAIANLLAKSVGFTFLKTIELSSKIANLYYFSGPTAI
jgi:RimJ/RimL family protein N-acetyltransferase